eukprot:6071779-Pyramimonas_sp.AAC.1
MQGLSASFVHLCATRHNCFGTDRTACLPAVPVCYRLQLPVALTTAEMPLSSCSVTSSTVQGA